MKPLERIRGFLVSPEEEMEGADRSSAEKAPWSREELIWLQEHRYKEKNEC